MQEEIFTRICYIVGLRIKIQTLSSLNAEKPWTSFLPSLFVSLSSSSPNSSSLVSSVLSSFHVHPSFYSFPAVFRISAILVLGSVYLWLTDPDLATDHDALFVSDLQDAPKKVFFTFYFLKIHLHHSSQKKSHKKITKQLKSRIFLQFLLDDGRIHISDCRIRIREAQKLEDSELRNTAFLPLSSLICLSSSSEDPDPYLWLTDPDLATDHALFVTDLQDAPKNISKFFLLINFWRYIYIVLHR